MKNEISNYTEARAKQLVKILNDGSIKKIEYRAMMGEGTDWYISIYDKVGKLIDTL